MTQTAVAATETRGVPARRPQLSLPDLHSQLEALLHEVWAQESFERLHPFTCAVMREPAGARGARSAGR